MHLALGAQGLGQVGLGRQIQLDQRLSELDPPLALVLERRLQVFLGDAPEVVHELADGLVDLVSGEGLHGVSPGAGFEGHGRMDVAVHRPISPAG